MHVTLFFYHYIVSFTVSYYIISGLKFILAHISIAIPAFKVFICKTHLFTLLYFSFCVSFMLTWVLLDNIYVGLVFLSLHLPYAFYWNI